MKEIATENAFTDHSIPYYYQIMNLLRQKIERGELAPGEKLPKELDLAKTFGVSRVTLRQALSILEADGLLTRERGQGTFIAKNPKSPEKIKLTGIIGAHKPEGAVLRLLSMEEVAPTPALADFFELTSKDKLTKIQRVRMVNKVAFCLVIHFLPVEWGYKITHKDIENRTMIDIIKNRLEIPLGKIHQTLEARTADNEVASLLSIGIMDPVLYVETFVFQENGAPADFSENYYRGNQHKYSIELLNNGNPV
jgi:GntR family transcriptional regulator